ncbi:Heavy metal-associated domain HMA domain-containing protein [Dioscorea alata]|uniref:Heavy metal-associated domain HMA domain-containing protein n=1 Tax=Dioscorea alata TaxID=55571 RepID=A0ACB7W8D0_DIOAL|nr:Heavy metal-associated domain HMA domain-containing protein [Dioscorea alata]
MRTNSNGNRVPGMLCRSEAATAVCVPRERSVIVPQRAKRSTLVHHEHARLGYDLRYSRLKDSRSFISGDHRRAVTLPMVTKKQNLQVKPSSTSNDQLFQVVVMKVSIHCQGCAGKVKKHISKMEGIDIYKYLLQINHI